MAQARYRVQHAGSIGAGVDGQHAGRTLGGGGVDAGNTGVSMGAAQDGSVRHAG